jgi:hypothetical protein
MDGVTSKKALVFLEPRILGAIESTVLAGEKRGGATETLAV